MGIMVGSTPSPAKEVTRYTANETDAARYYQSILDRLEHLEKGFWLFTNVPVDGFIAFRLERYMLDVKLHLSEFVRRSKTCRTAKYLHPTLILNILKLVTSLRKHRPVPSSQIIYSAADSEAIDAMATFTCVPRSGCKEAVYALGMSLVCETQKSSFGLQGSGSAGLDRRQWDNINLEMRLLQTKKYTRLLVGLQVQWALKGIGKWTEELRILAKQLEELWEAQKKPGEGGFEW